MGTRYGFANAQSFSKAFKREIGIGPRDFYNGQYRIPDMPFPGRVEGVEIALDYQIVHALKMKGIPLFGLCFRVR